MAGIRFLNLVKPVMFLIPEIKAPVKAVSFRLTFRYLKKTNSFGRPLLYSSISSVAKFPCMEFTNLHKLTHSTGSESFSLQTEEP